MKSNLAYGLRLLTRGGFWAAYNRIAITILLGGMLAATVIGAMAVAP